MKLIVAVLIVASASPVDRWQKHGNEWDYSIGKHSPCAKLLILKKSTPKESNAYLVLDGDDVMIEITELGLGWAKAKAENFSEECRKERLEAK